MKRNKSTNEEILKYSGHLQIQLLRGDRVIKTTYVKNKGKLPLFNFLAKALIGQYESAGTPKYIMLGNTEDVTEPISSSAIPYSSVSMEYEEAPIELARAVFKFLIPFSTIPNGKTINLIRLYNSDVEWDSHCAYIVLEEDDEIESDGKSNVLITWTMTISNQVEEE